MCPVGFQKLIIPVAAALCCASGLRAGDDAVDDLIGHWRFDRIVERSDGGATADSSVAGRPAVVHGAAPAEGPNGPAIELDGKEDYVALGGLGEHKAVTVAFWVKPGNVDTLGWQGLVTSDAWEEGVLHIPIKNRRIDVHLHLGDAARGRLSSPPLAADAWHHVAVTTDTGERLMRLFVNGYEEDLDNLPPEFESIKLIDQVIGREFDGENHTRYFRGGIGDVRIYGRALPEARIKALCPDAKPLAGRDSRNIRTGRRIPDEGYCDQPYTVITPDGNWLCVMTTGSGIEGQHGQHIVATVSSDRGRTWSKPADIEPADGPEASWVMPLVTNTGRVYGFYTYNGDLLETWNDKRIRTDTVGWYCYKYSDDNGRTWSKQRYRLPLPHAAVDRTNTFEGKHQIFWGIGKPITHGDTAWFAFSRCGQHLVDKSEGWFFRSDNILNEPDVNKIEWQLLPDAEHGLRNLDHGDVHAEQNLVALDDGALYCMYRTVTGYAFHAYSRDGGHTWTKPQHATYTPGGRKMKTPRACPRIWRTAEGRFLFWYHNHSLIEKSGFMHRNPVWVSGGVQKDGYIHWSQPEILMYDPETSVRISYPDLIQQDGRYWITETQKVIARVHQIDNSLLEGLWTQGRVKSAAREYLVAEADARAIGAGELSLPKTFDMDDTGGLSLGFWIKFDDLAAGQIILDGRAEDGRGIAVSTTESGTLQVQLNDGSHQLVWDTEPGALAVGKTHHVVIILDSRARILSFVVDGQLLDGGEARSHGWARYEEPLGELSGSGKMRLAPSLNGQLKHLRVYQRYLRTSEAIANFRAGMTQP